MTYKHSIILLDREISFLKLRIDKIKKGDVDLKFTKGLNLKECLVLLEDYEECKKQILNL